nr:hypothetical protein [Tanacetum cinerariifolium]
MDAFVSIPDEGDMAFLRKKVKSGAAVGKLVLLQVFVQLCLDASHSSDDLSTSGLHHFTVIMLTLAWMGIWRGYLKI